MRSGKEQWVGVASGARAPLLGASSGTPFPVHMKHSVAFCHHSDFQTNLEILLSLYGLPGVGICQRGKIQASVREGFPEDFSREILQYFFSFDWPVEEV